MIASNSEIKELISLVYAAGMMRAWTEMKVYPDKIRRKEAEKKIVFEGYEKQTLDKWVKNFLIKEYVGDKKNSPRTYSINEIYQMVIASKLMKMVQG